MAIKLFFQAAVKRRQSFLYRSVLLLPLFLLSGCLEAPPVFETPEDFRRNFSPRSPQMLPDSRILTLETAMQTALLNNPTNQAAAQAVLAARYGYYQSLSAYMPEINAGFSPAHTLSRGWDLKNPPEGMLKRNDHFITSGSIRASYLLFDGFARELEVIISRLEYRKSVAASQNVRRLLLKAVAFAYYDMYQAEEEIRIFREDLDFQNNALHQAEQQFRNGHVSKASVLNFMILAAEAKSSISNAEYRRKTAFHALSSLMGLDRRQMPADIQLQKITGRTPEYLHDEDFYLELAVKKRPDLKEERLMLAAAYRNRQKVYSEFLPVIRLFSEFSLETYHAKYGHYRYTSAHGNQRAFTYGAEGSWNIFRGFYSLNKLRRSEALEKIAMWGLNSRFLEIAAEVKDACADCRNSGFQMKVYQDMAQWVREQRDLVFSEYRNGRETITRVNEAQSTLTAAQSRLVISAVQYSKAVIRLAAATGTDIREAQRTLAQQPSAKQ